MPERAFPVIYARDVARVAGFYAALGFEQHVRLPGDGEPGYVGLRRGGYEIAVTTVDSPRRLVGVEPRTGPCFELFVYVDDVDTETARASARGERVLREPAEMPWGERIGWLADPEGNPVALATRP